MDTHHQPRRYQRGETSPERPGLVFHRYLREREVWKTPERLGEVRAAARVIDKRWKATPEGREYMRNYLREYGRLPKQVKARAAYFQRTKEQSRKRSNEYMKKWSKCEKAKLIRKRGRARRREKIAAWKRGYNKRIRGTPEGKLHHNASSRISSVFRCLDKKHKRGRTAAMLGCDFAFFRGWLEAQFQPGMTWNNYGSKPGQWEVDHSTPVRAFDITDPEQAAKAFHYTNCAPMWAQNNRMKSDNFTVNGATVRARDARQNIIPFKEVA